jgi:hypothetical protein
MDDHISTEGQYKTNHPLRAALCSDASSSGRLLDSPRPASSAGGPTPMEVSQRRPLRWIRWHEYKRDWNPSSGRESPAPGHTSDKRSTRPLIPRTTGFRRLRSSRSSGNPSLMMTGAACLHRMRTNRSLRRVRLALVTMISRRLISTQRETTSNRRMSSTATFIPSRLCHPSQRGVTSRAGVSTAQVQTTGAEMIDTLMKQIVGEDSPG